MLHLARKRTATWCALTIGAVCLLGGAGAASAQAQINQLFDWQGKKPSNQNGNNNWGNGHNWLQYSGNTNVPDSEHHKVRFIDTAYKFDVDLNDDDRSVGAIEFILNDAVTYHLQSSGGQHGILRNFGSLKSTDAEHVYFDNTITYYQDGDGTWSLNADPQYMVFNAELAGSGNITLNGGVTLNNANSYDGTFTINSGSLLKLGNANAMQNATVVLKADNGLVITTNSLNLGSLAGSGNLALGSHTLNTGGNNTSTAYSGILSGGTASGLTKTGSGSFTLNGANTYTGDTYINGGVIILGSSNALQNTTVHIGTDNGLNLSGLNNNGLDATIGALAGSGNLDLRSLTLTTGGNNASTTYSGVLSGDNSSGLVKTGSGDLTLSGASTYTGTTSITGGSITIGADNHLGVGGLLSLSGGALVTGGSFTLDRDIEIYNVESDTSTIQVNTAANTVTLDGDLSSTVAGLNLNKTGDGALRLNQTNSFAGTVLVNGGSIIPGVSGALRNATVQVNVDGGLDLTSGGANATFAGLSGSGNIDNGGHSITVNGSTTGTITDTYGGVLSGSGGLTVASSGSYGTTLTLSGANTFSGDTNINGNSFSRGTIKLADADALQNSTVNINTDNGLNVQSNGINANLGGLAGAGNLNIGSQRLSVGGNNASTTYAGVLSGASDSRLIKIGTGDLTFTGGDSTTPSDFGYLQVNSGNLILDDAVVQLSGGHGTFVDGDATTSLTLTGSAASLTGASLDVGRYSSSTGDFVVENGASGNFSNLTIGVKGTGHLSVQSGGNFDATVVKFGNNDGSVGTGIVSGASSLLSADTLVFAPQTTSGANLLSVEDGADVQVAGLTRFGSAASSLTVNGGAYETGTLVNSSGGVPIISLSDPSGGSALTIGTSNGDSTWNGLIQDASGGPGGITKTGTGTLTLTAANTYSGDTNIDGGSIILGNADALQNSTVSINTNAGLDINSLDAKLGGLGGSGNLAIASQTVTVGSNGASTTYSGVLSGDNDSQLQKISTGTLTLSGGVTNLGLLSNSGGGEVAITGDSDLQRIVSNGGLIDIGGATVGLNSDETNTFYLNNGASASIHDGADVTLTSTNANTRVVQTQGGLLTVTGTGSSLTAPKISVGPSGAGSPQFVAEQGAAVNASRFDIGDIGGDDGASGSVSVNSNAVVTADQINLFLRGSLEVNGGQVIAGQLSNFGSNQPISISDGTLGAALILGGNGSNSTIDNLIQDNTIGSGSIVKTGGGTLSLTGDNTLTGGATITAGAVLADNATGSATGSGSVQVGSGATLGGAGSVAGSVAIADGGTLAPGSPTGALTVGSVGLLSGSSFAVQLGGAASTEYSSLDAVNGGQIDGTLDISLINDFMPSLGDTFEILCGGGNGLAGAFDTVIGEQISDQLHFEVLYSTSDVMLAVVADGLPGDFNLDGDVDGSDFLAWQRNPSVGNLGDWQTNYETTASLATATAAPEPTSLALLALGGLALLDFRRRQV